MKAYPSDLESVVQRMIPVRDWPVIFDHTASDGECFTSTGVNTLGTMLLAEETSHHTCRWSFGVHRQEKDSVAKRLFR